MDEIPRDFHYSLILGLNAPIIEFFLKAGWKRLQVKAYIQLGKPRGLKAYGDSRGANICTYVTLNSVDCTGSPLSVLGAERL